MADETGVLTPLMTGPLQLDPFSYFPTVASKIRGLGGALSHPELDYGFHTHYVRSARGYCHFTIEFAGLKGNVGVLQLRVHMLSAAPGAQAKIAALERIELSDLVLSGGKASIRFESLPNMRYALYGKVPFLTDAQASGLTVTLDRPGSDTDDMAPELAPSIYGVNMTLGGDQLVSNEPAALSKPVSQGCTSDQMNERCFQRWFAALREPPIAGPEMWRRAYVLEVLERYGFLEPGATGLALDGLSSGLPEVCAGRGCEMVVIGESQANGPASDASTGAGRGAISYVSEEDLLTPDGLGQFDFIWSLGQLDKMGSVGSALRFVEASLERLRPRGLAIHIASVTTGPSAGVHQRRDVLVLARGDVERLALNLLSRDHRLAQLKFADPGRLGAEVTPFGLIVRRG